MATIYHRPHHTWTLPIMDGPLLWIESWPDPVVDRVGVPVCSGETERFWLPVLGPTATWLMRHLDAHLEEHPAGLHLDVTEAAQAIGVATSPGTKGPFARALARCAVFGLVQSVGDGIVVRRTMPPLPARYTSRLPTRLRAAHRHWLNESSAGRRDG
jgi:hypothetical protein